MLTHFSDTRKKRQARIRNKISGTTKRPRVAVFRSNRFLFVQVIDDQKKQTLIGFSDRSAKLTEKNKLKRAFALGKLIATAAIAKKVKQVIFDRGGYTYHGRVAELAKGLREGGLVF